MRWQTWILGSLLLAGCSGLLTGTRVFEFDAVRDGQPDAPGQPLDLAPGSFAELRIVLGDNDTYEKHRDDIESVDRAGFEGVVETDAAPTSFSLYMSPTAGLADPGSEATPLLVGQAVAPGSHPLTYRDTEAGLQNMEALADLVTGADFSLYVVADGPGPVRFPELALVVAFTVGL